MNFCIKFRHVKYINNSNKGLSLLFLYKTKIGTQLDVIFLTSVKQNLIEHINHNLPWINEHQDNIVHIFLSVIEMLFIIYLRKNLVQRINAGF